MSDRPRWWKADAVYSEVKKCIDDMFFLKPTPEIRNIIGACLGRAQKEYPVKIFWVDANVNHLHRGRAPLQDLEVNMSNSTSTSSACSLARSILSLGEGGAAPSGREETARMSA